MREALAKLDTSFKAMKLLCVCTLFCATAYSKSPVRTELTQQAIAEVSVTNAAGYSALANSSVSHLGCSNFRENLFEGAQLFLLEKNALPDLQLLASEIRLKINSKYEKFKSPESLSLVRQRLSQLHKTLFIKIGAETQSITPHSLKKILGSLKVGDSSSEVARSLQSLIRSKLLELEESVIQAQIHCQATRELPQDDLSNIQAQALAMNITLPVLGIRRTLATAYQSCQSLKLAPMTMKSAKSEGVEDAGGYPGGVGRYREITDQVALARTHYYVKDFVATQGCIDVKKHTMIYDYGGKPFTTSSPTGSLNFWKNNSDGSKGLGIDCSGFVFTSLAGAGLRLVQGQQLKAFEVEDYPARMYIEAAKNGFTCLEKAKLGISLNLRPGDIIATETHVVMVERIGNDPLAIRKYSDCSKITFNDFDFVIAQSSPEQNGVGINKYEAKEYLAQKPFHQIQSGLVAAAKAACVAVVAGQDVSYNSSAFGITRHKLTPDCTQSELKIESSACIDSCSELFE